MTSLHVMATPMNYAVTFWHGSDYFTRNFYLLLITFDPNVTQTQSLT